jgi:hypothetical protein
MNKKLTQVRFEATVRAQPGLGREKALGKITSAKLSDLVGKDIEAIIRQIPKKGAK